MTDGYKPKMSFPCDCCGLCCQNLTLSSLYSDLDNGCGVCRYFNSKTNKCSIYERRPLKCNIDAMYDKFYATIMTRDEFYQINKQACNALKAKSKKL